VIPVVGRQFSAVNNQNGHTHRSTAAFISLATGPSGLARTSNQCAMPSSDEYCAELARNDLEPAIKDVKPVRSAVGRGNTAPS
jgi:hypothetical protein